MSKPYALLAAAAALAIIFLALSSTRLSPLTQPPSCRRPLIGDHGVGVLNVTVARVNGSCTAVITTAKTVGAHRAANIISERLGPHSLRIAYKPGSAARVELWPASWRLTVEANVTGVYALINGSRQRLPVSLHVVDGSKVVVEPLPARLYRPLNSTVSVKVSGDATVRLYYSRVRVSLRVTGNASHVEALINETRYALPAALTVPAGSTLNVTPLPYRDGSIEYVPLNSSVLLNATGNTTIHLYWAERCRGVMIRSNVAGAWALVNGRNVSLPYCVEPPVRVRGGFELPLNATHRYWLGWYWVEEDGSRWWWSYGINGSTIDLKHPANITLHYLPGLKNLPYVAGIVKYPPSVWEHGCAEYKIIGGKVYVRLLNVSGYKYCDMICIGLELTRDVGIVSLHGTGKARKVEYIPLYRGGFVTLPNRYGVLIYEFFVKSGYEFEFDSHIMFNMSRLRIYQSNPGYDDSEFADKSVLDFWVKGNSPFYNPFYDGGTMYSAEGQVFVRPPDYEEPEPVGGSPNLQVVMLADFSGRHRGRGGIYFYFWIEGVAP